MNQPSPAPTAVRALSTFFAYTAQGPMWLSSMTPTGSSPLSGYSAAGMLRSTRHSNATLSPPWTLHFVEACFPTMPQAIYTCMSKMVVEGVAGSTYIIA